jgi:ring-1,2-phenylacetyl-CoA epoxidase subunit PaaE
MSAAFHTLKISQIVRETAEAISVRFEVPDSLKETYVFKPGQHLTLRANIDGEDVRRNYSLCVGPHEDQLKIAIKQISGGKFSNWAADTLKSGLPIEVMPAHGSFTVDFSGQNGHHYAGFAGGSGITPILSLLKTALAVEPHSRFTLFYGNRDSSAVIFLEELAALKNRYMARLQVYHFLSDEAEDIELFNGMMTKDKCHDILSTLVDVDAIAHFFICGPGPMMDAAESALVDRNVASSKIHIERFSVGRPSGSDMAAVAAQSQKAAGAIMKLTLDGRTRSVVFDAAAGNILDSARQAGLPAPYACKAGVCATCRAKVIAGEVTMAARYGLSDDEIAAGYVLTCQSIPKGDGVEINYDA